MCTWLSSLRKSVAAVRSISVKSQVVACTRFHRAPFQQAPRKSTWVRAAFSRRARLRSDALRSTRSKRVPSRSAATMASEPALTPRTVRPPSSPSANFIRRSWRLSTAARSPSSSAMSGTDARLAVARLVHPLLLVEQLDHPAQHLGDHLLLRHGGRAAPLGSRRRAELGGLDRVRLGLV